MTREEMQKIYLSYRNEFLTVDRCAEYYGIHSDIMLGIVKLYSNRDERICDITEDYSDFLNPSDLTNFK